MSANFLLASSAGGRMPVHLQVESGFEDPDVSSMEGGPMGSVSQSGSKRQRVLEDGLENAKIEREKLSSTMGQVASLLQKKMEQAEGSDEELEKVRGYSKKMTEASVLETMSPQSRDKYVDTLKRKRKDVLEHISGG